METLKFSILINATKQKVWHTMLDDKTYREWTTAFHSGSFYEGSWDKGSEIRFLGPDENGKMGGMFSRIKENIQYEFISIEHLGMINNGVIDTTSEEVKKWAPSLENYTFTEIDNQTEVKVEMQIANEFATMFDEMWPNALKILKRISEE
ncbi:MAG: hypothetical protein V4548_02875 [Bacteroidota bacterium]